MGWVQLYSSSAGLAEGYLHGPIYLVVQVKLQGGLTRESIVIVLAIGWAIPSSRGLSSFSNLCGLPYILTRWKEYSKRTEVEAEHLLEA